MSEERKNMLDKAAESLEGLTAEQADRVLNRAIDFMAGAATRERIAAAEKDQKTGA